MRIDVRPRASLSISSSFAEERAFHASRASERKGTRRRRTLTGVIRRASTLLFSRRVFVERSTSRRRRAKGSFSRGRIRIHPVSAAEAFPSSCATPTTDAFAVRVSGSVRSRDEASASCAFERPSYEEPIRSSSGKRCASFRGTLSAIRDDGEGPSRERIPTVDGRHAERNSGRTTAGESRSRGNGSRRKDRFERIQAFLYDIHQTHSRRTSQGNVIQRREGTLRGIRSVDRRRKDDEDVQIAGQAFAQEDEGFARRGRKPVTKEERKRKG